MDTINSSGVLFFSGKCMCLHRWLESWIWFLSVWGEFWLFVRVSRCFRGLGWVRGGSCGGLWFFRGRVRVFIARIGVLGVFLSEGFLWFGVRKLGFVGCFWGRFSRLRFSVAFRGLLRLSTWVYVSGRSVFTFGGTMWCCGEYFGLGWFGNWVLFVRWLCGVGCCRKKGNRPVLYRIPLLLSKNTPSIYMFGSRSCLRISYTLKIDFRGLGIFLT